MVFIYLTQVYSKIKEFQERPFSGKLIQLILINILGYSYMEYGQRF